MIAIMACGYSDYLSEMSIDLKVKQPRQLGLKRLEYRNEMRY
jgi:hypothetical protein